MNYWYSLIGLVGFGLGYLVGYKIGMLAKRIFLDIPTVRMTPEQYREMYERQKLIEQLNLVTVQEIDKIRACSTNS